MGRSPALSLVEQADRVLAPVAGEVAVVAVDHGQAGAHEAGKVEGGDAGTLVFPARRGGYLDLHDFRNREWKPAQITAGMEPLRRIYAAGSAGLAATSNHPFRSKGTRQS